MKPRILLLTDPFSAPGYQPRVRYLCEYLKREGYSITLITEKSIALNFEHSYPIIEIPIYNGKRLDWIVKTAWTILTNWHNRAFAKRVLHILSQTNYKNHPFDLVLCSTFSDFPLSAALDISRSLHVPLLCDIRDLDEQVENSTYQYQHKEWWAKLFRPLYRTMRIRRRNKVLSAANAITTISPWHLDFLRRFNNNVHIVYNGFDEKQFFPGAVSSKIFKISYIGTLYEWQKAALQQVQIACNELPFHPIISIHTPFSNPIRHDQLGEAIRESGIMLVLTSTSTHGMLTTKFYEALGCAKPILCVPSDEGALSELIAYTNAGVATNDMDRIKRFIIEKYSEWEKNGYTQQDTMHREEFSRGRQCEKMEEVINNTLSMHVSQ